ncbi:MAG: nucleotidyltransferase domain-containing protein [Anaerolineae bacterium]
MAELVECAQRLLAGDDRVIAVGLFGSLARRQALPSSDADVLIVLREHPQPRWFDRIAEYVDAFAGASLPVEPFPYTHDELERMRLSRSGFLRTILRELIPLGGETRIWKELKGNI